MTGKVVLVTVAAKGIRRAVAVRLAMGGKAVVAYLSDSVVQAEETAGLIEAAGGKPVAVQAEVSKVADATRLFDAGFLAFGRLDALVNNDRVVFTKPVAEVGEEEFDRLFGVNVKGALFCCREAANRLAAGGRIVTRSSSITALMLPDGVGAWPAGLAAAVAMLIGPDAG